MELMTNPGMLALTGAIVGAIITAVAHLVTARSFSKQSQREWVDDRRWQAYVGMERVARQAVLATQSHADILREIAEGPRFLIKPADVVVRIMKLTKWARRMNRIENQGFEYMAQLRLIAPAQVLAHANRFLGSVVDQTVSISARGGSQAPHEAAHERQRLVNAASELTGAMRADLGEGYLDDVEIPARDLHD